MSALTPDLPLLELATENAELRLQLGEVQDQFMEIAVDAGELHAHAGEAGSSRVHQDGRKSAEENSDCSRSQANYANRSVLSERSTRDRVTQST